MQDQENKDVSATPGDETIQVSTAADSAPIEEGLSGLEKQLSETEAKLACKRSATAGAAYCQSRVGHPERPVRPEPGHPRNR